MSGRRMRDRPRARTGQAFDEHQYRDIGQRVKSVLSELSTGPTVVYLPSNVVVTSGSYVSLTGLEFPVAAGVMTNFRARVYWTASSTSGGAGLSITGPASPTRLAFVSSGGISTGTWSHDVGIAYDGTSPLSSSFTSSGTNMLEIMGGLMPSIDGTATIRMAGETTFTATALALISYVEYF